MAALHFGASAPQLEGEQRCRTCTHARTQQRTQAGPGHAGKQSSRQAGKHECTRTCGLLCGAASLLLVMDGSEGALHERLGRDGALGVVVSRGVVCRLAHRHVADDAIVAHEDEALAAPAAERVPRPGVRHEHADGLRELAPRVGKEGDDGALHALVLGPRLHHGAVVHAVDEHLVDAGLLQLRGPVQISRNLHRGSAGGESPWQAHDDHLAALRALGHVHLPDGVEAVVNDHGGDLVTHGNRLLGLAGHAPVLRG
mmetsp:Transcript_129290/g.402163  ORF Transcript_129290/g.402163 Transcript_129290/m.402163 type:complete len:256 (+) Transcript_129290:236-1003(+)